MSVVERPPNPDITVPNSFGPAKGGPAKIFKAKYAQSIIPVKKKEVLSRRYKIDTTNMPPWRRWSTKLPNMGSSLHIDKKDDDDKMESMIGDRGRKRLLPIMVHPNRVKIATGDIDPIDMDDFTLAVTETVPFAYKYHHPSNRSRRVPDDIILQRISTRVNERLPDLNDAHMIKILLAFDRIRPKVIHRTAHPERYFLSRPLAYINQPFMTSLYQAIKPTSINNTKVLLALFTAYTRCGIHHPQWIRSVMDHACNTWLIDNTLPPTSPRELADIVLAFASTRVKKHDEFLHILTDEIEDNFNEFDEDAIGDVVRAFLSMRYGNKQFFTVLGRELPHRIHEYRWWNLVDISELYMILKWPAEDDPDMIMRFGNEVWKYHKVMSGKYVARALRVLAYLETSDRSNVKMIMV
ncbi:hypothetical protein Pmar_PMAR005899 [Perkinsus marinus ATCC 50983]|uniref:Uncharacterized protein n=1 Tax=Perkinsus marinus (strain ATCC 50983 / TXsc) TaxID=423536 RepID=C5LKZ4_PERM5|nr:hypothetical protein Pmar_PMAR005899 [Perkinsus marinus ATCC 50983]EER02558.1 hypothetical protein Pmar_PMAR005899 [Perkinsus marinus ATCC 50983]|eukprot:XP_002769840.1 hypothetical protein Pmar_PMAR005899 [Perkinsus marinus ATCC 50983]